MKTFNLILSAAMTAVFDNDVDALIPELWANEALLRLENQMIMGNLVHRDYSDEIANFGDTVNTHRPSEFTSTRKGTNDNVTIQNVDVGSVPVRLDQHHHVSFLLRDGEESKSFKDLVDLHLVPAASAIAQGIDETIMGEAYNFLGNQAGQLGVDPVTGTVTKLRSVMTKNKAPMQGRNLVVSPDTEATLLNIDKFVTADKVGDEGTALREGSLGRKFGFDIFMSQNAPSVAVGVNEETTGLINAGNLTVGSTVLTYDAISNGPFQVGGWVSIAGDQTPHKIAAQTATVLTLVTGLRFSIVDNAKITSYVPGKVNNGAGYVQFYSKSMVVDNFTVAPQIGQLVSTNGVNYGAMSVPTTTALTLSQSLQVAAVDNDVLGLGPAGEYSFGFHRNAISLVVRPLAQPRAGTGAASAVISYNGLSIRVTITYDGNQQGHLVTLDLLAGVKTLDTNLGALMLG